MPFRDGARTEGGEPARSLLGRVRRQSARLGAFVAVASTLLLAAAVLAVCACKGVGHR